MSRIEEIKSNSNSYLVFNLENERFATHVAYVNQIIEVKKITSIPHTMNFVKGVINHTGKAIPVIDCRLKFNMTAIEITPLTNILIMEVNTDDSTVMLGVLVDRVSEVVEISEDEILPTPSINGTREVVKYVEGIVNLDGEFTMLLNIDKLLEGDAVEISEVEGEILEAAS